MEAEGGRRTRPDHRRSETPEGVDQRRPDPGDVLASMMRMMEHQLKLQEMQNARINEERLAREAEARLQLERQQRQHEEQLSSTRHVVLTFEIPPWREK